MNKLSFIRRLAALIAAVVLAGMLGPLSAWAEDGAEEHDGFFMRFRWDYGWGESKSTELIATGRGGRLGMAIGVALEENVILYGMAMAGSLNVVKGRDRVEKDHGWLGLEYWETQRAYISDVGGGLSYYWIPDNIFAGVEFYGHQESYRRLYHKPVFLYGSPDRYRYDVAKGPAIQINVGKEIWISDNWALGILVAAEAAQSHMFRDDHRVFFRTVYLTGGLTLTYN